MCSSYDVHVLCNFSLTLFWELGGGEWLLTHRPNAFMDTVTIIPNCALAYNACANHWMGICLWRCRVSWLTRLCSACLPVCALALVVACIVGSGILIWMQFGMRQEVDVLREHVWKGNVWRICEIVGLISSRFWCKHIKKGSPELRCCMIVLYKKRNRIRANSLKSSNI